MTRRHGATTELRRGDGTWADALLMEMLADELVRDGG